MIYIYISLMKAMESIIEKETLTRFSMVFLLVIKSGVLSGPMKTDLKLYERQTIRSADFPDCCKTEEYLIQCLDKNNAYLQMTFDDLDLPSGSQIQIYDGANASSKLFPKQPHISRGAWSRPVIASSGKSIYIKVNPSKTRRQRFVGFKATVYASDSKPDSWKERPFTDCPRVHDPMDSGKVRLKNLTTNFHPDDKITYRYDCTWQIKPPSGEHALITYLKLLQANLDDGTAYVMDDIDSDSTKLFTFRADDSASVKGLGTIESNNGFYIRAEKPMDSGEFSFLYGVYQRIDKPGNQLKEAKYKCHFNFHGKVHEGFRCQSTAWCIPVEHACNKLDNCPDGSDESSQYCNTTMKMLVNVGRILHRDFECHEKKCPDGSCIAHDKQCGKEYNKWVECPQGQKFCINGQCIRKNDTCPGNCSHLEWKCDNGLCASKHYESCYRCKEDEKKCTISNTCVKYYERCPESKCPIYKDFWCGVECTYQSHRCDGVIDCRDNSDEKNCGRKFKDMLNLLALLVLPAVVLFLALTHRRKKLCGEQANKQENRPNDTGMRAPFVAKKRRNNKQRTKSTSSTRSTASQRSTHRASSRSTPPRSPNRSPRVSPGNSPHSETVPLVEVKDSSPQTQRGKVNPSSAENNHVEAEATDRTPLHV